MSEETLFHEALSRPPAERAAFLDQACAGQPELRAAVNALLAAHDEPGSLLDRPAAILGATVDSRPAAGEPGASATGGSAAEQIGRRIGPYKLLQQLGEGGMGTVYVAEQEQPVKRRVALKVIKPGMDSAQVLRRFETERQALALMDHPNIARVLDADTTAAGRPYFVMELVKGEPITKYCDGVHLPIRDRLALFTQVCAAIQHAHQKGIIHRDLKPGNILVCIQDGRPVPKVIDFGVAKALHQKLTERTMYTEIGAVVGTLEYMSPEQAELSALDIDTRADVYALGVLLYELLTGTTPLDRKRLRSAAYAEVLRLIKEEEPPRPSTRLTGAKESLPGLAALRRTEPGRLAKEVRGELDWIVMKALEKDRTRRYEAASDLARDVERHLHDEPVEACPPGAAYRLKKFLRRHKRPVIAAALVLLALLGGLLGTGYGLMRADEARRLAEANEKEARESARKEAAQRARALAEKARADDQADAARANQYVAHMNLAQIDYDRLNFNRLRDTLDFYRRPPRGRKDPRGWEWYYLDRMCQGDLCTLRGHRATVLSVVVSPDGKRIVSGGWDMTLKVWDVATGRLTKVLKGGHANFVSGVAFSPDGRRIVSASFDTTLVVWDAASGRPTRTLKGHTAPVMGVAVSPNGNWIVSGSADNTLKIWDAATGRETRTLKGHTNPVTGVAVSPDGKRIVSGSYDNTVKVWDAASGRERQTLRGHTALVASVAVSPDGKRIVSGSYDNTVKVWDAASAQASLTLKGHGDRVASVAFSRDGRRIVSGSFDHTVKVWDAAAGRETLTLKGHADAVESVAFHPDGRRVVSGSRDATVKTWDAITTPEALVLTAPRAHVTSIAVSPDGRRVAAGSSDPTRTVRNPAAGQGVRGPGLVDRAPGCVKVWDATTGQQELTLDGHGDVVDCVAFSPDGRRLASGSRDTMVKIWNLATGQAVLTLKGHAAAVMGVTFSPDSRWLVSGSEDMTLKLWDAATGRAIRTLKGKLGRVASVAVSPDGTRIVAGGFGPMAVWDAASGREILTLKGHGDGVTCVAFSRDGKRIVSGSWDRTQKVWDAATGRELLTLKGHAEWVRGAAFSPDGKRIVSGGGDQALRVWDAATGQETLTLKGSGGPIMSVAFGPDGRRVFSASFGTVTVWDARELTPDLRAEREALGLVRFLFARPLPRAEVIDKIPREETVAEEVRRRALALADSWR